MTLDRHQQARDQLLNLSPSPGASRRLLAELVSETDADAVAKLLLADDADLGDPAIRLRVARLYHQNGRLRDAEESYRALLAECPDEAILWHESGVLADEIGAADLAVQRLTRSLSLCGEDACDVMTALAKAFMHAGHMRQACRYWLRLTRRRSQAWAGVLVCALCIGKQRLEQKAARVLTVHTSLYEQRQLLAGLWHHASVGVQLNRIADGHYTHQCSQKSPLSSLLNHAANSFKAHAEACPDRADTYYHAAVCLEALGRRDESDRAVQEALQINPRYRDALHFAKVRGSQRQAA